MSKAEVCEARATREDGTVSSHAYSECMDEKNNSNQKNENASRTRQEVEAGTIPWVELTDEENVLYELTGDNQYVVGQIAQAVGGDSDESNNITEEDLDAVLEKGCLPDGTPLTPELKRALVYMKDQFNDMTDESLWNVFDTGDLSVEEITEWAQDEHDTTLDQAKQKKEQQRRHDEQLEEREQSQKEPEQEKENEKDAAKDKNDPSNEDKEKRSASAMDVLEDPKASSEEKLKAIVELKEAGRSEIELIDNNGKRIRCRISVEPVAPGSDRNYVHLFAIDENGKEQIVLRGLEQDGKFSRQGNAGYVGDRWSGRDSNIA
ncbi:MAG: hypothetical protein C0469_07870 [Cyanobacteria bacterium DS2.3.42]|nr:hypothetical protein [Cyanobacteria bacterium DS2.3.42]